MAFKKRTRKKQVEALEILKHNIQKLTIKDMIPENTLTEEAKNELNEIKEIGIRPSGLGNYFVCKRFAV